MTPPAGRRTSPEPPRYLLEFGYDGAQFAGWARQPGRRTVEGEIREGLRRLGLAEAADDPRLEVASRTDRGVHARANALALSSDLPPAALLRALNGLVPDIFFRKLVAIPPEFRVRAAEARWYRYWERPGAEVPASWASALAHLRGRVDVRSLGRDLRGTSPVWRDITRVQATVEEGWVVLDVEAPSFVWGMVRKIVASLREVEAGRLAGSRLAGALRGGARLTLPLAEPERLVLWEVRYPIVWSHEFPGRGRLRDPLGRRALDANARGAILTRLACR